MAQYRSFIGYVASIGKGLLRGFTPRHRLAVIRPPAVLSGATPAYRGRPGAVGFASDGVVGEGRHRGSPISSRAPVLVGVAIVLVAFVGFGGWAAIAPIDSAAIAPGVVAVAAGRQVVQHLEGGIVEDILVRDGDHVKAGDVLVRLDGARAKAELALVQGQLDLAEATEARLTAERDGVGEPQYPADLMERISTPEVAAVIAGQSNVFKARLSVWTGQKNILRQQIEEFREQINGYEAIETSKKSQLRLVKSELSDLYGLLKQGYVTRSRVLALERQADQLNGEESGAMADGARARQGIEEANRKILELDYQRQEDISKDLYNLQGQLSGLRQKWIAAQDVVRRLDITAPVSGTVTNLQIHTVGGVIGPGAKLVEIVPANNKLIVEAEVSPLDIDTVHAGQDVSIRVSVAGGRLLPAIYGKLEQVSADRMETPTTANAPGRGYYQVRISIPSEEADRLGDVKLKVGMPVEAMITRGSRTALHYALKPFLDSFSKAFREP